MRHNPNQLELGIALKTQGQSRAANAATEWSIQAQDWIWDRPRGTRFTADDLINAIGLPNPSEPNSNNAVGAALSAARKGDLITPNGYTPSTRAASHARIIRVWERV